MRMGAPSCGASLPPHGLPRLVTRSKQPRSRPRLPARTGARGESTVVIWRPRPIASAHRAYPELPGIRAYPGLPDEKLAFGESTRRRRAPLPPRSRPRVLSGRFTWIGASRMIASASGMPRGGRQEQGVIEGNDLRGADCLLRGLPVEMFLGNFGVSLCGAHDPIFMVGRPIEGIEL